MAGELAAEAAVTSLSPSRGRVVRTLRAFRDVREELRRLGCPAARLETLQFEWTAERCDESVAFVANLVDEWMLRRPLKYIAYFRRKPVMSLITRLRQRNVRLGVLSDYPVSAKLVALGLTHVFGVTLCTTEPAINAFKPHAKGFLIACDRFGLRPREVAYVGDRIDVDAVGARAAGMECYLVGRPTLRDSFGGKAGFRGSYEIEDLERLYGWVD
jgi:HAD superfamily hydrolase (TIGR01549 family)